MGRLETHRITQVVEEPTEDAREVLVEFWDDDEPATKVDRCMVACLAELVCRAVDLNWICYLHPPIIVVYFGFDIFAIYGNIWIVGTII